MATVKPVDDCGSYANAKQCSKKGGECEWKDDTCSSAGGEGVEIDCGSLTKKNCQKKSSGVCAWMDGMCAPSPGMKNFGANENVMGADAIEHSNSQRQRCHWLVPLCYAGFATQVVQPTEELVV